MIHPVTGLTASVPVAPDDLLTERLLRSIARDILGGEPTRRQRGRYLIGPVVRDYIRYARDDGASVELCIGCGQRAWRTTCGCGHAER